jgi:hypothetical protein
LGEHSADVADQCGNSDDQTERLPVRESIVEVAPGTLRPTLFRA